MSEVIERRKATTALINRDPQSVALLRSTIVDDGYGGAAPSSSAVAAQTFRLASLPRPSRVFTETGEALTAPGMVIAAYNADIEVGDIVTIEGSTYEVIDVREYDWKVEADLRLR